MCEGNGIPAQGDRGFGNIAQNIQKKEEIFKRKRVPMCGTADLRGETLVTGCPQRKQTVPGMSGAFESSRVMQTYPKV